MHRNQVLILLFLLVTCKPLLSQEFMVKGKAIDSNNKTLSFVNVLLLKAEDSVSIAGTSTEENGTFILNKIPGGDYILKTSYIGYHNNYKDITVDKNITIESIILNQDIEHLEEVTLTSQKPRLEKRNGRLIFQVENSTLSSLTTYEILQRTPAVIIVGDKISIKNTKTTVYINDKRVYLSNEELKDLLNNFSGSNIASIEIITNPPSKYDAEGGSVLNIVTSKNISIGYKGSVNGNYEQGIFPKYQFGTNHYYKSNFLNLYAGYSFNPRKDYKRSDSYVNFFDGDLPSDQWNTSLFKTTRSKAHNLNTVMDFTLDSKNTLSITSNLSFNPQKTINNKVDTYIFDSNKNPDGSFISNSGIDKDNTNLSFNTAYMREIGENGTVLNAQINYVHYNDKQLQDIVTDYFGANNQYEFSNAFNTNWKQQNNIFTGQIDMSTVWNKSTIDFGSKYSEIKGNSTILFSGNYSPEQSTNDDFEYNENIWAGYASINREWDTWTLDAGIRGEYTDATGNSLAYGTVTKQDYFEIFPTISIYNTISDNHEWGINYKRAINRPQYQSLNPYRYYLNENNFIAGNPTLTPSIENKITLDYTYKGNYIFSLYYQHVNNEISSLTFQNNQDQFVYNAEFNIDESFQYSIDFIHYRPITKWWFLSTYMSGFFYEMSFIARESNDAIQTQNTVGYFGQLYNSFTISKEKSISADVYLEYVSRFFIGNYLMKDRFKTNIGLRKKLWNGRASLNINLNDVFNTYNIPLTTRYLNQDNGYTAKPEQRTFTIGFNYKFGNFRLADNKRNIDFKEEERLKEETEF